ncbi:uncharacterized protein LOC124294160 [Neodiprion lecontei]|uniref:Uncharacterized protein LOC124294160 n=1 Tax=Neodiprion lecontei TaxID=441921 RepID=A0ABM3G240_NEOLC|nr:uncharacterized protein LOC124294160 [Neodiprion lecontei]
MNVSAAFDVKVTHEILAEGKVLPRPQNKQPVTPKALHSDTSQKTEMNITPKTLRIGTQRRSISRLRSKIYRVRHQSNPTVKQKKKLSEQKIESIIQDSAPFLFKEAKILFETQLRLAGLNKYGKRYADNLKDIALSILYHSPKARKYLKKFLNLPSERTLRNYQSKFPIYPGLNKSVLNSLKAKFRQAP